MSNSRLLPKKVYCVFQGQSATPFAATSDVRSAVLLVTIGNTKARDYHMAEYMLRTDDPFTEQPAAPRPPSGP